MPDEYKYVRLPNGKYGKFRSDADNATMRAAILKDFPDAFGAPTGGGALGALKNIWNKQEPDVQEHAKIFNQASTGGGTFSELGSNIKNLWTKLREQGPITVADDFLENTFSKAPDEAMRKYQDKDYKRYVAAVPVVGSGLAHGEELGGSKGLMNDLGMIAGARFGEVAVPGTKAIAGTARDLAGGAYEGTMREAFGVPERALEKAKAEHELDLSKIRDDYEKQVQKTGERNAQSEASHQLKIEQAKQKYSQQVAEHTEAIRKASAGETGAETRKSVLTRGQKSGPVYQRVSGMADKIAADVPRLDKAVRQAYDARWGAWRQAMGDATGNFTNVQLAIEDAEQNILKGSPENITIFRNMLKEGEDPLLQQASVFRKPMGVDVKELTQSRYMNEATRERVLQSLKDAGISEEPSVSVAKPGTELPIDDIRGYATELGNKMYNGSFSGDVYRALKSVKEAAESEVEKVAKDKGQLDTYRQLKGDWRQYMEDFYDHKGPLYKVKNSLNSDSRLSLLTGPEAGRIIDAMGRYSKFGPDISGVGRLRSLMKQISELPSSVPKTPAEPRPPRFPGAPTPQAMPEIPNMPKFNVPKWVEERVTKRAEQMGTAGHKLIGYWVIADLFRGRIPPPEMLAAPLVQHQIMLYLQSPKFIQHITEMTK